MEGEMVLRKIEVYKLVVTTDEWSGTRVKGYYVNQNVALSDAIGAGFYGTDGDVIYVNAYENTKTNEIFEVELKKISSFVDIEREYKEQKIAEIKAKLTPAELELLGVK